MSEQGTSRNGADTDNVDRKEFLEGVEGVEGGVGGTTVIEPLGGTQGGQVG